MADITQVPGVLNITTTQGDDLSILLDFDITLTSYTFSSKIKRADTLYTITVVNTDLSTGKITLTASNTLLETIPNGEYSWYLDWVTDASVNRRVLSGKFVLQA